MSRLRRAIFLTCCIAVFNAAPLVAFAEVDCKTVRIADIGWTDVSATTGVASRLLSTSGYTPRVLLLSLPVTLAGLKNQDIDIFLGNWMPTQEADIRPYINDGSVEIIGQNLQGAKYTLAVPTYTFEAGLKSFSDIHKFKDQLKGRIYGIEPGNDGNRLIIDMINKGDFDLQGFQIVESSEQGMLLEAKAAVSRREHIVFLGWAPHPMNNSIPMKYLSGGDKYFGPNFGEASVFTLARKGFSQQCPGLASFFKNLVFTIQTENEVMGHIIDDKLSPENAAIKWLSAHKKEESTWKAALKLDNLKQQDSVQANSEVSLAHTIHQWSDNANEWITTLTNTLSLIPPPLFSLLFAFLIFLLHGSLVMTICVATGFMAIATVGLWSETMQTLTLVFLSTVISSCIGIPIGIWSARHEKWDRFFNPLLDLMQTLPTFVYLIPTLLLFGLGIVPGLISTIIFAVAAPIRLTRLGIRSVPLEHKEVGEAFGASKWQSLFRIEIPSAFPLLLEGVSQCVMLSMSMVVIAALVGAEGLGAPVIRALNTVNLRMGAEAGIAIVILAAILDRSLRRSSNVRS